MSTLRDVAIEVIEGFTTAELLAEYNKYTGKETTKFASRKKGEEQFLRVLEEKELLGKFCSTGQAVRPKSPIQIPEEELKQRRHRPAPTGNMELRSLSIKKSWDNPEIAAVRAVRDNVEVNGKVYRSTHAAFVDLGLPTQKCIKFRKELKAAKKATFTTHDGKKIDFKVVQHA